LPSIPPRSLFVAAMTRTSCLIVRAEPARPLLETRAGPTLAMSPTRREYRPRSACSNLPDLLLGRARERSFSCPAAQWISSGNRGAVHLQSDRGCEGCCDGSSAWSSCPTHSSSNSTRRVDRVPYL
jgi:hypothetical protein